MVAGVLRELGTDVALLQEVQRRQAKALAGILGWGGVVWRLKHWPIVIPAEGLAMLSRAPVSGVEATVLARHWAVWSSHRRIAMAADVDGRWVVNTHLGAGIDDGERGRQASVVVELAARGSSSARATVIGGDLNARPGSPVIDVFTSAGYRDTWVERRGDDPGFTNWRSGSRDGPPVQRLDHLLAAPGAEILDVQVPRFGDPGFDRFGALSDHLPVTVEIGHG